MEILKIAAFSEKGKGGNPAGVVFCDEMPPDGEMLRIAKQVGYSETAFLHPIEGGWRVRYFAPQMEVPFCGHATIASGAALGERFGEGKYNLRINNGEISVSAAKSSSGVFMATLQSPETWSVEAPLDFVAKVLKEFNLAISDLNAKFPLRFAFAGAKHLMLVLQDHEKLKTMSYHFENVKALMAKEDLVTIDLLWAASDQLFHARNPFPPGGVYEDPATGAAAAALAGYLRDIGWPGGNSFDIMQGEEMGSLSRLKVQFTRVKGSSIQVSGETRYITE
jgi:PhzF family phenazine biosynthesis protein